MPNQSIIFVRRLLYLHEILSRSENELIHKMYLAMEEAPLKDDGIHLVRKNMANID